MANELESRIPEKVLDVVLRAREEVVEAKDLVPLFDQPIAQMGSDEAGTARDEDALPALI
jgi:hypothetical protein